MRPPICRVCNKRMEEDDKGGLIYFAKRPSDEEWGEKMKEKGWIGHPPYADWFCEDHYDKAKEFSHLSIDKAMKEMK